MALALCMVNPPKSSQDLGKRRSPYIVLIRDIRVILCRGAVPYTFGTLAPRQKWLHQAQSLFPLSLQSRQTDIHQHQKRLPKEPFLMLVKRFTLFCSPSPMARPPAPGRFIPLQPHTTDFLESWDTSSSQLGELRYGFVKRGLRLVYRFRARALRL